MQMEQNAFKDKSLNSFIFPQDSRFGARGFEGGDIVEHFDQLTTRAGVAGKTALKTRVEGTMMKVDLAEPLAPGKTATFDIAWHFLIPEHGADRMGRDGPLYELAQWYPRVAVYDDVRGWNIEPYLGQGEFYLEYGDFTYAVTVPGRLHRRRHGRADEPARGPHRRADHAPRRGGEERLGPYRSCRPPSCRAARRDEEDRHAHVEVPREERARRRRGPRARTLSGMHRAGRGKMAYAYYRPTAVETWKDAADMSRMSIMEYSERWLEYPYPQISAIEGRSAAWSTRWSRWRTRARTSTTCTTSSRTRSGTCGSR
jgi:hypothetical protein